MLIVYSAYKLHVIWNCKGIKIIKIQLIYFHSASIKFVGRILMYYFVAVTPTMLR